MSCVHHLRLISRHALCIDMMYENPMFTVRQFTKHGDKIDVKKPLLGKDPIFFDSSINNSTTDLVTTSTITSSCDSHLSASNEYEKGVSEVIKQEQGMVWVYFCFFLGGIALNLSWGSISFFVSYWEIKYGANIWPQFLVCYNVPGFPVLLLQLYTDHYFSKIFGTRRIYVARIVVSFIALSILAGLVPFTSGLSRVGILIYMTGVGIAVGAGHGWAYSLASLYPVKAVSYLVAGGGMSSIILLVLTIVERNPSHPSFVRLLEYFEPVLGLSVIGIIFLVTMISNEFSANLFKEADRVQKMTGISPANSEASNDPFNSSKVLPSFSGPQSGNKYFKIHMVATDINVHYNESYYFNYC
eukprot:TRINITY_DN9547_c0_g1_i1.p1 TRINITY_DN9547_c0_g1~~TRINITY_DN9547_c0_g1_i1.p1  ORF type:complete len:357 (-),score=79.57 TRINITY_DN9547_c0_g1_i1:321-1391(-)